MNAAHDYFGKNRNVSKEIKCFNCGGRGHMRADCPKAKKMKCPLCAGAHDTFSCPDRRCILCTKRGHIASDCQSEDVVDFNVRCADLRCAISPYLAPKSCPLEIIYTANFYV